MKIILYFLAILSYFGCSEATCYVTDMNILTCVPPLFDTDFPLNTSYHGTYDMVYIGYGGLHNEGINNLTKIPAGGLSGISTRRLEIVSNAELVTIESGFMQGSEMHVEEIYIYYNSMSSQGPLISLR